MDRDEFDMVTRVLTMAADTLAGLDLRGYLAVISRDDALGPILDPTAYRSRMSLTPLLADRAEAALAFVNAHAAAQGEAAEHIARHNQARRS